MRGLHFLLSVLVLPASAAWLPASQPTCAPTRPDAEGPFYKANAPERSRTGKGFVITGTVKSASDCAPLGGARIEWWSANSKGPVLSGVEGPVLSGVEGPVLSGVEGEYDDEHRATQKADKEGRYRYETDSPGLYPGRPLHLHARVTAPGHRSLITQIYPKAGQAAIDFDFVLVPE